MLKPLRRVVTGLNAAGRSVVVSDETAADVVEAQHWPGRGITALWSANQSPASNADEELSKPITPFPVAGSGGVSLMVMQIAPEAELEAMPSEQRAKAMIPSAWLFPEAMEIDISKSHHMHATDTMDYLILLSGELTLVLDEGEVDLKPFDTVIQRGVNHGWVNRGKEPALLATVILDARRLERVRKPRPKRAASQMW